VHVSWDGEGGNSWGPDANDRPTRYTGDAPRQRGLRASTNGRSAREEPNQEPPVGQLGRDWVTANFPPVLTCPKEMSSAFRK